MLADALNALLAVHSIAATIERPGVAPVGIVPKNIRVTSSNYTRTLSGPEETAIKGREFVISKRKLDEQSYPIPRRGDRLVVPTYGTLTIEEVVEMPDFGGAIMAYRVRTG